MTNVSQSKKIAISAIAVFVVSFSMLLFFLKDYEPPVVTTHTNVLEAGEENVHETADDHMAGEIKEEDSPVYLKYLEESSEESQNEPIFVTNPQGEIAYANEEFCKTTQHECQSIKGNLIFDYINSKDVSDLAASQGKIVHDGEKLEGLGPFRMLKGKTEIFLLFTAEPLVDDDEKVSFIVYRIKDITKKVKELNGDEEGVETTEKDNLNDAESMSIEEVQSEEVQSEEVQSEEVQSEEVEQSEKWIKHLYPKVDELKEDPSRLMVNKTA